MAKRRIAIIGAGLSGLTVFNKLKNIADVTIFEKSASVGGRINVRYSSYFEFDHGAQFFTVKDPNFSSFLKPFIELGVVKQWNARFAEIDGNTIDFQRKWGSEFPHYIGAPAMNSFLESLSGNVNIIFGTKVEGMKPNGEFWKLYDGEQKSLGCYDWVISTAPAPQTNKILPRIFKFRDILTEIKMSACFSLMVGFSEPIDLGFEAAVVKNSDLSWISFNSSKPDRTGNPSVLAHSSNEWADQNIDIEPEKACQHLLDTLSNTIELSFERLTFKDIKLWRYANVTKQNNNPVFLDTKNKLGACGDWCFKGRVEAAFQSGERIAKALLPAL